MVVYVIKILSIKLKDENYHGEGIKLSLYQSLHGTCVFWNNICSALFDAKTLWLTYYNQQRLLVLGASVVLLFDVSAAEAPNTILLVDQDYNLPHHGVEYCVHVLKLFEDNTREVFRVIDLECFNTVVDE